MKEEETLDTRGDSVPKDNPNSSPVYLNGRLVEFSEVENLCRQHRGLKVVEVSPGKFKTILYD